MKSVLTFIALISLFFIDFKVFAQRKYRTKEKYPTYFGIQIRPVLPTQFIGKPSQTLQNENYKTTINQLTGYSFGGTVRAGFTNTLAFETGIHFIQRNYHVSMAVTDSNVYAKNDLSFIAYDIPLNLLMYVQMSEKIYMNGSLGIVCSYKPTNIGILTKPGSYYSFTHTGWVKHKTGFGLNANLGIEFRSKKCGFFYLGGSAFIPFSPVFYLTSEYKYQGFSNIVEGSVDGSYLTFDFKYFFPNTRVKENSFLNGPIE